MQDYSSISNVIKLILGFFVGGNMSEQGADKAGKDIATGLRFLFKSCGLAICIGVILWLLPDLITAIRWW
ncbi:hypothetical protein C3007_07215 [Avibacterium gallinarum]|uniref:Uncharacterized protein n=1 Tax=Avibacterium gallinarum TaxID=755 RepID=A0A379AZW9_AVIGA|nr:hypothetical protein [Avibacterium gallinarum]POY44099.1 hypothetical protein C3007_07215 [Avibacterium gallinarum]TDP29097.1 hypothetical protein EV689_10313 [Avibacterium gallinarum]SUB28505.1 Uncharacterised protein [Avibacterium gallinarum]